MVYFLHILCTFDALSLIIKLFERKYELFLTGKARAKQVKRLHIFMVYFKSSMIFNWIIGSKFILTFLDLENFAHSFYDKKFGDKINKKALAIVIKYFEEEEKREQMWTLDMVLSQDQLYDN